MWCWFLSQSLNITPVKERLDYKWVILDPFAAVFQREVGAMGQILDKLQGKEWRKRQIRKITDRVFDNVKNHVETERLSFADLYIAVLLVYNDINKFIPGPHSDPPSKDRIREVIKICDINFDGEIDRDEFYGFIQQMIPVTFSVVSQKLLVTLFVAPTVAVATKRATEGVPCVGKVVQRLPNSVYASLVTIAAVWFQRKGQEPQAPSPAA
ncbi:hypothetical protein RJT34_22299 [Clitoria ternatea]|uniref:EF-hand domain-containing protein n=1 Tax=Clitoria ternatea TaxID=43366 RepID=A0AAN9IV57_CLITE